MVVFSVDVEVHLPPEHRFPMGKYAMLRQAVTTIAGVDLRPAPRIDPSLLGVVHEASYLERVLSGQLTRDELRRLGFPWSPSLVERSLHSVGATLAGARAALLRGRAASLAGGTHHAFADHGAGFCLFNDVAVTLALLLREGRLQRAAILDLDVHQGDGTAAIFANETRVFCTSMHAGNNYPFRKQRSDLDVELADGTGDEVYLEKLDEVLDCLLDFEPQLVCYLAGADGYHKDRLGRLGLTIEGLLRRDQLVFQRLGTIPSVVTMAGGYADPIEDTVLIQANTIREALSSMGCDP